jgi:ATP/maltotriose-dependent transcriptional regulator MalT
VPDADEQAGVDWTALNILAADAAVGAGESNRGLSMIDQALAEAMLDPPRRAELVERRAFMLRVLGRDDEAARQLRDALALLPDEGAGRVRAVVLASLANSLMRIDDMRGAATTARLAATAAADIGTTAQRADALITLGSCDAYLGDAAGGLTALREGVSLAERHEYHRVALRGYVNLSDTLEMLGRHDEAVTVARTGSALATRIGVAGSMGAMITGNLAEPLIRLGRWREALDLITEALADEPTGVFASTLLLQRGELHLWQGDTEQAERDLRDARRSFGDGVDLQFTVPMLYIETGLARSRGHLAEARRRLQADLHRPVTGTYVRYAWPLAWLGMRIEADIAAGAPTSAAPAAREHDRLTTLANALPATTPPALAYRAMVDAEAARLSHQGQVAAWQLAVEASRAAAEAFPLCYSLYRLAEAQVTDRSAGTDAATTTAHECLRLADDLAAATGEDIQALARRARLRIVPATPSTSVATVQPNLRIRLTDRELQVLSLVAEGRSNGQIAAALYISPKTASVHVSNILAKLNAATRTEAAARAHRLGLLDAA